MFSPRSFLTVLLVGVASVAWAASAPTEKKSAAKSPNPLVWDAMEKTVPANAGDGAAEFRFSVSNTADQPVEIREIRTSCGCTVAEMPASPWVLAPGGQGSFRATVDIRGRFGKFFKTMMVVSSAGAQVLAVTVDIAPFPELTRNENRARALGDRQAVFRGACYSCHVEPIGGKQGALLFDAACAICHEANPRAEMVPDLRSARGPRDAAFWRTWITEGREKTLMPAFGEHQGGPLSEAQIESLVVWALKSLPTEPAK